MAIISGVMQMAGTGEQLEDIGDARTALSSLLGISEVMRQALILLWYSLLEMSHRHFRFRTFRTLTSLETRRLRTKESLHARYTNSKKMWQSTLWDAAQSSRNFPWRCMALHLEQTNGEVFIFLPRPMKTPLTKPLVSLTQFLANWMCLTCTSIILLDLNIRYVKLGYAVRPKFFR